MYIKSYIKDRFVSDDSLSDTKIISPITNQPIITFSNLTIKYVNEAYEYASFIQNKWRNLSPKEKILIFTRFAKLIKESKSEFVSRMIK